MVRGNIFSCQEHLLLRGGPQCSDPTIDLKCTYPLMLTHAFIVLIIAVNSVCLPVMSKGALEGTPSEQGTLFTETLTTALPQLWKTFSYNLPQPLFMVRLGWCSHVVWCTG